MKETDREKVEKEVEGEERKMRKEAVSQETPEKEDAWKPAINREKKTQRKNHLRNRAKVDFSNGFRYFPKKKKKTGRGREATREREEKTEGGERREEEWEARDEQ